jgi:SAM-dependent methyltransferase
VLSQVLDEDMAAQRPLPRRVLDAGCGVGVIGICVARALTAAAGAAAPLLVHCQDRDELARLFTLENAARNGIGDSGANLSGPIVFSAHTEPLLSCEPGESFDLVLSNVPAKAGTPVLEDFAGRSLGLLAPGGRAAIVVVNTLAEFFRRAIGDCANARLIRKEAGVEHTVFVYGAVEDMPIPKAGPAEQALLERYPFYLRGSACYEMEGVGYHIDAVHGAAEFDSPSMAVEAAARLLCRLDPAKLFAAGLSAGLVHEGGQGHFPVWLLKLLEQRELPCPGILVLHGRNVLGLEAAGHNITANATGTADAAGQRPLVRIVPGVDLGLDRERLQGEIITATATGLPLVSGPGYGFIAAFPQSVPQTDRYDSIWKGLEGLLMPGGSAILAFSSTEADRFDKRKPLGFTRLGDLKRQGFRALAYWR